jgi:hypothetical protein
MIVPIKIQCGCGQRYAFDAEAETGQMPFTVACPVCGTDGTPAANSAIAQMFASQAVAPAPAPEPPKPAAPAVRLHVATPTAPVHAAAPAVHAPAIHSPGSAPAPRRVLPGQTSPEQAMIEARAKIFWGDPQEDVVKYLMIQGFSAQEASEGARDMFEERVKTLRSIGVRKLIKGVCLMLVPLIAFISFMAMGYFPIKIFAVTVIVGVYGAWLTLRGTILFLSPRSETCDVANE